MISDLYIIVFSVLKCKKKYMFHSLFIFFHINVRIRSLFPSFLLLNSHVTEIFTVENRRLFSNISRLLF